MHSLLLVITLFAQVSLSEMRNAYLKQDENNITRLYKLLKQKQTLSADEECYYAAFECLQAKYSNNPYTKYTYFSDGYERLGKLIVRVPKNPEYRYHRWMIEKNAPAFLIKKDHNTEDKIIIKKYNRIGHPLYKEMAKIIE